MDEADKMMPRVLKIFIIFIVFTLIAGISGYLTLTWIVKSEDTVIVPKLIGKDTVYALELLTALGLNAKIQESVHDKAHPKDYIVYQDPESGSEIKKGRDVKLVISKGASIVITPNLKRIPLRQSQILLNENDLCMGHVSFTYDETVRKNEIITQVPVSGTPLKQGDCVNLLVSKGGNPHQIEMPDLRGLSLDDAILTIETAGLVLGEVRGGALNKNKPLDSVMDQRPLYGHRVTEGTTVNLVRNSNTGTIQQGIESVFHSSYLFRYRLDNGFLKKRIRIRLDAFGVSNDMFNRFVAPGEEIWLIIPKQENAVLALYEDEALIDNFHNNRFDGFAYPLRHPGTWENNIFNPWDDNSLQ